MWRVIVKHEEEGARVRDIAERASHVADRGRPDEMYRRGDAHYVVFHLDDFEEADALSMRLTEAHLGGPVIIWVAGDKDTLHAMHAARGRRRREQDDRAGRPLEPRPRLSQEEREDLIRELGLRRRLEREKGEGWPPLGGRPQGRNAGLHEKYRPRRERNR